MPRLPSFRIHLALFVVAFFFSLNYIISKLGMRELTPLTFAWLRVAGAAIVLQVVARNEPKLARDDAWRVALFSLLGVVINQTLFLSGLARTSVQVAAILITTIPVFALAAAIVARQERATARRVGGIVIAGIGALLVVAAEGLHGTSRSFLGALMVIGNCMSFSLYLVVSKPAMARLSARRVVERMFTFGTLMMLPIAALSLLHEPWGAITTRAWLALGIVIAGPTVGAYLLNAWALRYADSSLVAAYTYLQPVIATLLGALFLGEAIRHTVVLAGVLIVGGVALASSRSTMEAPL
jgi:drug/metabolite transporter (DMT)-like permease